MVDGPTNGGRSILSKPIANVLIALEYYLGYRVIPPSSHWNFPFKSLGKIVIASLVMTVAVYPVGNSLTSSVLANLIVGICIEIVIILCVTLTARA